MYTVFILCYIDLLYLYIHICSHNFRDFFIKVREVRVCMFCCESRVKYIPEMRDCNIPLA